MPMRRPAPFATRCALLALAVSVSLPAALGQQYVSDPFDARLKLRTRIASRYAQNPSGDPTERQEFRDYVEKYLFPAMTQATPEGLEDARELRYDLFNEFIWDADPSVQAYLTEQAYQFAAKVIRSRRYHPSVMYNALLILGQLDSRYATDSNPSATPLAKANAVLNVYAAGAAKSARAPRYWLLGALVGLERHCRHFDNLPAEAQQKTEETLLDVLTAEELAGEYNEGVRDWAYLRAGEALANTGSPGAEGRRLLAVAKRLGDPSLSLETRAKLAAMIDRFGAEAGAFDTAPVVASVVALATEAAKQEGKTAEDFEALLLRGGGRANATGPSRNNRAHRYRRNGQREYVLVRAGLLDLMTDLTTAVRAARPLAEGAQAETLGSIDAAIQPVLQQLANPSEIDLNITAGLKRMASTVTDAATPDTPDDAGAINF